METQSVSDSGYNPSNQRSDTLGEEDRIITKNANLELITEFYDKTIDDIEKSIQRYNVVVLRERENEYDDNYRRMYYSFKVESSKLDEFLEEIKNHGEVESFSIESNDITKKHIDYTQRLQRYNNQMQRYENMLLDNDLSIEEEIDVQERISSLEDDIFRLESQIKGVEEDVEYSDVTLRVEEEQSLLSELNFMGFKEGFKLFLTSLEFGIKTILSLLGFIIPLSVIYGIYRIGRRFK